MTQPRKEQLSKLITGTPNPANVGDSPASGSSGFASPSDHTHAHGIHTDPSLHQAATSSSAGFMSAVQASQLNSANKASVLVATTADITLSGLQTIDGVAVVAGNRILVKDQATGSQNGIYVVANASWSRSTDLNLSVQAAPGAAIYVEQGTTHAGSIWILITPNPITLDSTTLTFSRLVLLTSVTETLGNNFTSSATTTIVSGSSGSSIFKTGSTTKFSISTSLLTMSTGVSLNQSFTNGALEFPFKFTTTPDGYVFDMILVGNTLPDHHVAIGWDAKGVGPSCHYTWERSFDSFGNGGDCFEMYQEVYGAGASHQLRPWFAAYNKANGDMVTVLESGNGKGISFIDVVNDVGTSMGGFTPSDTTILTTQISLGLAGHTTTTNVFSSFFQLINGGTLLSQTYFLGAGVGVTDIAVTSYGIRSNANSGQSLYLQSLTGSVGLFGNTGTLGNGDTTFTAAKWNSNGIQLVGATPALGGGAGVVGVTAATTAPTADPASGVVFYVDSGDGSFKFRGASGNTIISFPNGTVPKITQADKPTTGVGAMLSIYAQKGGSMVGNTGGILRIGGGSTAASTTLAGATQIDLGTATSNTSAKLSLLVTGSSVLDISQTAASTITHDYGANNANILSSSSIVLNSPIIRVGTSNYPSIGLIRLENASAAGIVGGDGNGVPMVMRNFANDGDLRVFQCNSGNDFVFGSQDPRDIYVRSSRNVLLLGGGGTFTFDSSGNFILPSGSSWGPAGIQFTDGATANISQIQSTSGVGATFTIFAAQGKSGSVGGILRIGGGAGGSATNLAGDTQIFLGTTNDSIVSAKFSIRSTPSLSSESSIMDIYQGAANTTLVDLGRTTTIFNEVTGTGAIKFSLNSTNQLVIDVATVPRVSIGTSSGKIGFFNSAGVTQRTMADSTTGTPAASLVDVGVAPTQANINNNFATIARLLQEIGLAHS